MLTKQALLKLIAKKETETIELKPSLSQNKEIIETISAFANSKGGSIFIGVNDNSKVLGLQIGRGTIKI